MAAEVHDKDLARNPSPAATAQQGDRRPNTPEAAEVKPTNREASYGSSSSAPLPYDGGAPPLPDEPVPDAEDDGWEARWDNNAGAWYYFNHKTGISQWENPRVPTASAQSYGYDRHPYHGAAAAMTSSSGAPGTSSPPKRKWGGYNPKIHGSFDPNADYAKEAEKEEEDAQQAVSAAAFAARNAHGSSHDYTTTAQFNRFNGKQQQTGQGPEMHNDENKSRRQMNAFFDVDAAANSHDGRSLKAERRAQPLSKKQLKEFNEKRKAAKEAKRRAWLRD
ncbi:ww domain-containing protein [Alternaria burnsii]|uniref:Ww domain-containing protein n=1 Tax=Alternaria burnsii TaxID=1187904 RepID=A0A8H7EIW6_9PLEO|nr:ww domain-containing protein [Alternaria burnsii]KAF7680478.1 ww domain-containing protein [Alternaria burnsii]CAI9628450.1 unnamed protein product [Alternaria burnsii]